MKKTVMKSSALPDFVLSIQLDFNCEHEGVILPQCTKKCLPFAANPVCQLDTAPRILFVPSTYSDIKNGPWNIKFKLDMFPTKHYVIPQKVSRWTIGWVRLNHPKKILGVATANHGFPIFPIPTAFLDFAPAPGLQLRGKHFKLGWSLGFTEETWCSLWCIFKNPQLVWIYFLGDWEPIEYLSYDVW